MISDAAAATPTRPIARGARIVALALLLTACAGAGPRPPLPIADVVKLSEAGTEPELVIAKLRSTRSVYAPRGADFGKLADLGVKPPVLDFIQVKFVNDVELLTRYFVLGESLGGCVWCFPQPLDLGNLATGGSGMSPDLPTGNYYGGGLPPGIPAWIPASPGLAFDAAPAITIDEIAARARSGMPAEELAAQIRRSRVEGVIAQGGTNLGTLSAVGLLGSQFAALHRDGVPAAALDALQEQYLAQFIEFQRLRYQNWGKGPSFN